MDRCFLVKGELFGYSVRKMLVYVQYLRVRCCDDSTQAMSVFSSVRVVINEADIGTSDTTPQHRRFEHYCSCAAPETNNPGNAG